MSKKQKSAHTFLPETHTQRADVRRDNGPGESTEAADSRWTAVAERVQDTSDFFVCVLFYNVVLNVLLTL